MEQRTDFTRHSSLVPQLKSINFSRRFSVFKTDQPETHINEQNIFAILSFFSFISFDIYRFAAADRLRANFRNHKSFDRLAVASGRHRAKNRGAAQRARHSRHEPRHRQGRPGHLRQRLRLQGLRQADSGDGRHAVRHRLGDQGFYGFVRFDEPGTGQIESRRQPEKISAVFQDQ